MSPMRHPCPAPQCPAPLGRGVRYCPTHQAQADQRDRETRGTAAQRGYDAYWVRVRDAYAREHPLCEDHLERGETVAMTLVDHKIPLPYGERLDPKNLRSLCDPCHGAKSARDRAVGYDANVAPEMSEQEHQWIMR